MIRSFKSKEAEQIFQRHRSRDLPPEIQSLALRKLRMLNRAVTLLDLPLPPANRLETLSGDWAGQYSIQVNDQWCICFIWDEGDVYDVEIVHYH